MSLNEYTAGDKTLFPTSIEDVIGNQNMALRLLGMMVAEMYMAGRGTWTEEFEETGLNALGISIQAIEAVELWMEMNNESN